SFWLSISGWRLAMCRHLSCEILIGTEFLVYTMIIPIPVGSSGSREESVDSLAGWVVRSLHRASWNR
ncbi:MAG: hypothetical protein AABY65_07680, partial [Nitrospirota bacterium]